MEKICNGGIRKGGLGHGVGMGDDVGWDLCGFDRHQTPRYALPGSPRMLNVSTPLCSSLSAMTAPQKISHHSRPSDDAIEAIIHHATSSRQDLRPLRDTRTQLFVGNVFPPPVVRLLSCLTPPSAPLQSSLARPQRSLPQSRHRLAR